MIDHCIAAFNREQEEWEYRGYITDALMAIAHNTHLYFDFGTEFEAGYTMTYRWGDGPEKQPEPEPADTKTAEEIAGGIFARMRGE